MTLQLGDVETTALIPEPFLWRLAFCNSSSKYERPLGPF